MNIKIEPRKPTDRGGYICMPLKKNVPEGHADWKPAKCPVCGSVLWMVLERIIYGKVQPRSVDDIIGLILFWYIFKSEL